MALEKMVKDPITFAAKDPQTFDWVFTTVMR